MCSEQQQECSELATLVMQFDERRASNARSLETR